jgi:hypothetical protein
MMNVVVSRSFSAPLFDEITKRRDSDVRITPAFRTKEHEVSRKIAQRSRTAL